MSKKNRGATKGERREARSGRNYDNGSRTLPGDNIDAARIKPRADATPIKPLTDNQGRYMNAINTFDLTFSKGPAGTGKTFIPAVRSAEMFTSREISKIIITRPAVGAGEELGFFPGDMSEKVAPWAAPVVSILEERLGAGCVEYMLKAGQIEIAPLGMLRGHTFKDAFIIFDEAQNATKTQMKLFLTRIGQNVKVVVDGDPDDQTDIVTYSGLKHAWDLMHGHPQCGFVEFTLDDIVRSGLCKEILIRYHNENKGGDVGQAELDRVCGDRSG